GVEVPEGLVPPGNVWRGRLSGHAWEQLELPGAARRQGCRVTLHLANPLPLAGGPHAVVLHDATVLEHPARFARRYRLWHRRVLLPAARRAGAVGTLTEASARSLAPFLGRPATDLVRVPQGVAPFDAPAPPARVASVRRRFGLEGPYFLFVGAGDPRK